MKGPIPFFTDQNVANSAGAVLVACGHKVVKLREVMPTDTKDPLIGIACAESGQVLVSHDKDFKAVSRRLQITQRDYRERLHRIHLECSEPDAARRLEEEMRFIEAAWDRAGADKPMVISLRANTIQIGRM